MEKEKDFSNRQPGQRSNDAFKAEGREKNIREGLKKFWLMLGISMGLVSSGVWLYFLTIFFLNPSAYAIIEESNRTIAGIEILLQLNMVTVLIYYLVKKLN